MKVKVHNIISEGRQTQLCIDKLRKEWVDAEEGRISYQWPQASAKAIDAERQNFPLVTFKYTGKIVGYVPGGSHEDFGAMAIVVKEDGFLSEELVSNLQVIEEDQ